MNKNSKIYVAGHRELDTSKPDGTHQKRLGWRAKVSLRNGVEGVYGWYCDEN